MFAAVKRQPGEPDVNVHSVNITPSALKMSSYLFFTLLIRHYDLDEEAKYTRGKSSGIRICCYLTPPSLNVF